MTNIVPQDDLPSFSGVPEDDLPDHLRSNTWEDIKKAVSNLPEDVAVAYKSRLASSANAFDRSLTSIGMLPNALYELNPYSLTKGATKNGTPSEIAAAKVQAERAQTAGTEKAQNLKERIKSREAWANPDKRDPSFLANLLGSIGALPSTVASIPLQMVEPAQIFTEQGESPGKIAGALALGVPNAAVSVISPAAYGDSLRQRIITGAGQQAAQQYAFGKGFAWLADKPTTKEMFNPTPRSIAEAAVMGGGFGAATKTKKDTTVTGDQFKKNLEATDSKVVPNADIPKLLETSPGDAPAAYGYKENTPMTPSQLKEWANTQDKFKQYADGTSEQQRYAAAQAAIEARQKALEFEVAKQGKSDFNAAERARQEAAPTGYEQWVEAQRQAAEQRQPGDNTPVDFNRPLTGRTKYHEAEQGNMVPEDITLRQKQPGPENLVNEPFRYEGGIDAPELKGVPSTLPIEVQDIVNRGMHEQTLPQQVLEILQTKSPDQVAREKSLPLDVQIILNTPKEPPPHAPWAKPIAGLTMGKAGRQRGALDMSAFTEGFKGLNKWLSKLTDEPWVRQRFPASLYESNQDGTPRVLLHGSSSRFNDTPKATSLEGFHAGYAGPSHMKASIGVHEHGPTRTYLDQNKLRSGYTSNNLKYKQGEDVPAHVDLGGGAIYPVVIRKGNYPHINKTDLGSFDPSQLQNQTRFLQAVAKATNGRYGFYDVKEIMDNWWSSAKNMNDRDMILKSWSRMLKDQLGIDGFYYKNGYESANRKAHLEAENIRNRRWHSALPTVTTRTNRLNVLAKKLDSSESFVTWDNNNIRSLYDEPIKPDTTGSLNKGMSRKQRGGIDLKALGLDLTHSALRGRFTQRLRESVDYLTRQIKEDFPELARVLNRPDVKQLVEEIHQSTKERDPIQFWMEKLAGVSSKEDPTLGGQLKPLGKFMTGQAKGPKDMLDLHISEKLRIEEQQFAQIINQLYKHEFDKYSKGKLPSYIENPAEGVKWGLEHGYADPIFHDSRMQNKEFAKNYELQTEQIKQYNRFIDKFHQHFSKKYGFDPSHFAELHPEWEQAGDHTWGLIFGLADHLRHDENSFISNRAKGIGRKQSGQLNIGDIADSITKGVKSLADRFDSAGKGITPLPAKEDILSKHPGMGEAGKSLIAKGRPGDVMLQDALANIEKQRASGGVQDSKLWSWAQSGGNLTSEKLENIAPWFRDVSRWIQYSRRKGLQAQKEIGTPLNTMLRKLSPNERDVGRIAMLEGMLRGEHLTEKEMADAGATPRTIALVKQLQDGLEKTFQRVNQTLIEQGRDPLTRQDAYLNSLFHGDWATFVRDKNGSLVWPVHSPTKAQAELARLWLKDHFKDHPDIVVPDKVDHIGLTNDRFSSAPRDQLRAFANTLDLLKDPKTGKLPESASVVRKALEEYIGMMGENYKGTNKFRVEDKYNRRGFEGDKPWLSNKENTSAFWEAQIRYMENAHRWSAISEMMHEVKKLISDETLIKEQPNAVALAKAMLLRETGISQSVLAPVENAIGKIMPSFEKDLWTQHRQNPFMIGNKAYPFSSLVHSLKAAGYFGLISNSLGYIIATPLQAIPTAMYWYSHLHQQGLVKESQLNPKAWAGLMKDLSSGFSEAAFMHKLKDPFYREAMDWASENSQATNILFEDMKSFSESTPMFYAKWWTNATMTRPDQLTRVPLFLSFANSLWKGGKFATKAEAFQRASEIVDHTMVSMRAEDRPLAIDKMGFVGDAVWMMKAPMATLYNTFSHALSNVDFSNPKSIIPLMTLVSATAIMGGVHNMPVLNELEGAVQVILRLMAEQFPAQYAKMIKDYPDVRKWISLKEAMISTMPDGWFSDVTNWGLGSKVLGPVVGKDIDMSSRFNQSFIDIEHPMGAISPLGQEVKEWVSAAGALKHGDMRSVAEGAYAVAPPLAQGIMEMSIPQFRANEKNPNQFLNPRDLRNPAVRVERDQGDQTARWMGLTSLDERKKITKNMYANNESFRRFEASQAAMKELFVAVMDKKPDNIVKYGQALATLDPELKSLETFITTQAQKNHMDPQKYAITHANTLTQVMNVVRRAQMDQQNATKP